MGVKQQAVLFRASHHSGPLEVELTRRDIPFVKFGGLKFLEAAHIKDMLALLRFVEIPRWKTTFLLRTGTSLQTAARLPRLAARSPEVTRGHAPRRRRLY